MASPPAVRCAFCHQLQAALDGLMDKHVEALRTVSELQDENQMLKQMVAHFKAHLHPAISQEQATGRLGQSPPPQPPPPQPGQLELHNRPGGRVQLDYGPGCEPGCAEADADWLAEMTKAPEPDTIRAHLAYITRNPQHPIGSAIRSAVGRFEIQLGESPVGGFNAVAARLTEYIAGLHRQMCRVFSPVLDAEERQRVSLVPIEAAVLSPLAGLLLDMCRAECLPQDREYAASISRLRVAGPAQIGVPTRFSKGLSQSRRVGREGDVARCGVLLGPMRALRKVSSADSPFEKVSIIKDACRSIAEQLAAPGVVLGADDMLPLLVFCFVQADVPQLASELHYMSELLIQDLKDDELGYFLACGAAALGRIIELGPNSPEVALNGSTPRSSSDPEFNKLEEAVAKMEALEGQLSADTHRVSETRESIRESRFNSFKNESWS